MNIKKTCMWTLVALAGWAWHLGAWAQTSAISSQQGTQYTAKGADTCIDCHDQEAAGPGFSHKAVFQGKHGQRANPKVPFGPGGLQCESCHGPGANHSVKNSKKTTTINSFKASSVLTVKERNEACLGCHQDTSRSAWHAGSHDRANVACADCHKVHAETGDPMLNKAQQPEACFTCHKQQRTDFQKSSSHPVRQGKMSCSDCHNGHGSTAPAMLNKPTLNQACYSCHADKRGPLLWEHAPVAEDCSTCHSSHGSVRSALLKQTPPLLCQQCHSPSGHPSVPRTSAGLPANGGTGAIFTVAGSCSNCHSQVHGSNHPAGKKLMR